MGIDIGPYPRKIKSSQTYNIKIMVYLNPKLINFQLYHAVGRRGLSRKGGKRVQTWEEDIKDGEEKGKKKKEDKEGKKRNGRKRSYYHLHIREITITAMRPILRQVPFSFHR